MTFIIHWSLNDKALIEWQQRRARSFHPPMEADLLHKRDESFGVFEIEATDFNDAVSKAQGDMTEDTKVILVAERDWLEAL